MSTKRQRIVAIIFASLCGAVSAQSPYSSLQVPKQIQYQGRVATGTGGAWSGTEGYFTFALVQGATVLWNNWEGIASPSDPGAVSLGAGQVLTLPVNGGVFSIRLGEGSDTNEQIPVTVFFDTTSNSVRTGVKLAVWFSPSGSPPFTRLSPDVEFMSVPYAMVAGIAEAVKERAITQAMLAPTAAVPVGGVIAWCGTLSSIPEGFELCEGGSPTTLGATYLGQKPDLRGRFLRGAEISRSDVRGTVFSGGSDSIAVVTSGGTAINVSQMPAHRHGGAAFASSTHQHWLPMGMDRNGTTGGGIYLSDAKWGSRVVNDGGVNISAFSSNAGPRRESASDGPTSTASIPMEGGGGAAEGQSQPHTHIIPGHDNRPAYLELFYIIRVK